MTLFNRVIGRSLVGSRASCARLFTTTSVLKVQHLKPAVDFNESETTSVRSNQRNQNFRNNNSFNNIQPELEQVMIRPELPTFYSFNPPHEDHIAKLSAVLNKYSHLPNDPVNAQKLTWLKYAEYAEIGGGTRLRKTQYAELLRTLKRLASIEPQLLNDEIVSTIKPFIGGDDSAFSNLKLPELDEFGRAVAVGKRKTAVAKAFVVKGTGEIKINERGLHEYFRDIYDRDRILFPLKSCRVEGDFNVFVRVRGGGISGQAGAAANAIAKALAIHNPLLRPTLNRLDLIKRDRRVVERKKPGKLKARKMPTWVKR